MSDWWRRPRGTWMPMKATYGDLGHPLGVIWPVIPAFGKHAGRLFVWEEYMFQCFLDQIM